MNWVDLGSTGGERHFLKLSTCHNFRQQKAFFAVEFDAGGKRYRSNREPSVPARVPTSGNASIA